MKGFYKFAMRVMSVLMPLWYHIETEGTELLPEEGGYLYVSNHRSMADPILIGVQNPQTQFCFLAKQELFSQGLIGWLLKQLGAVAIDRGSGDLSALDELEQRLKNGENALIFPEGTRSKDGKLGHFKTGAALIAAQTGAPVVPVGISFEGKLHFRSKIHVQYGAPFHIPLTDPENPSAAVLKQIRQDMTRNVAALLPAVTGEAAVPETAPERREKSSVMMNRRIDYGRIALILTVVILGIFAVDFVRRLWRDWRGMQGSLTINSSQVDSISDPILSPEQTDGTGSVSTTTGSGGVTPTVTSTTEATLPSDYSILQIASSTANSGSLILVSDTHLYTGTPELTAFKDFTYAHLRLPVTSLQIENMTIDPLVSMFNDFYAATGFGDIMIYATTNEPSSVQYGTGIAERTTGLSIDLAVLNEAAGYHTPYTADSYSWIAEHAHEYGYVLRYPEGKEDVTGESAMSWHYRYVGVPHAAYMKANDLCLEEYLKLLAESHTWQDEHLTVTVNGTSYEMYYVEAKSGSNVTEIPYPTSADPMISGDNMNGFVVACVTNG